VRRRQVAGLYAAMQHGAKASLVSRCPHHIRHVDSSLREFEARTYVYSLPVDESFIEALLLPSFSEASLPSFACLPARAQACRHAHTHMSPRTMICRLPVSRKRWCLMVQPTAQREALLLSPV